MMRKRLILRKAKKNKKKKKYIIILARAMPDICIVTEMLKLLLARVRLSSRKVR
jgi:hypothetical protein